MKVTGRSQKLEAGLQKAEAGERSFTTKTQRHQEVRTGLLTPTFSAARSAERR
jgi:hypothetical protein